MKIFEYAIVLNEQIDKASGQVSDPARILVEPTRILAKDESQAAIHASRAIPEEFLDKLERIDVAVRPF